MGDLEQQLAAARDAAMKAQADESADTAGTAPPPPAGAAQPEKERKPDPPPPGPDEADFIEFKYKGKPVRIAKEDLPGYVERGYDYSRKMQALNDEKKALDTDAKLLADYREFKAYMAAHPDLARTVQAVTQRYDEKRELPNLEDGLKAPIKTENVPSIVEERLRALEGAVGQRIAQERTLAVARAIHEAVQSAPTFAANPKLAARAEQKLAERLQADPDASLEALVAQEAAEVQSILETLPAAKYLADKKDDKARFGTTERPDGLTARQASPPPKPLTWADMDNGEARRKAMEYLANQ